MDKKGKLFGVINIIDLLVIVLLVAMVGFVGYKMTHRQTTIPGETVQREQDMYVKVICRLAPEEAALNLNTGDRCVAKNAFVDGEIYSVSYTDADYVAFNSDGQPVLTKHPLWKDITVVIKGTGNPSNAIISIGGQESRIGANIFVKTQKVEVSGTVMDIQFGEWVEK